MIYLSHKKSVVYVEEWIFQQDNVAFRNASITKKYLFELDHPACSPVLNPIKICGDWGLQKFMKGVDNTQQFLN